MRATEPLPIGSRVALDPRTRQIDDMTWVGGTPTCLLRLTPAGARAWPELSEGIVRSRSVGVIARKFTDAGLAHPQPDQSPVRYTVVIPVRDRAVELVSCLRALGSGLDIVVVDDGSARPDEIAGVAAAHGALYVRREANGGPAAARNTGLQHVATDIVVFVDSDTLPSRNALDRLGAHFADPLLGAVAPRVRPVVDSTLIGRYSQARSSLDLGPRPARVAPGSHVAYVPTAVFAARLEALRSVEADDSAFDETLRYGEDVDLVWRLNAAGWRVRYEPSVVVRHAEPSTWRQLVKRRYLYGTSAGPLGTRHGAAVAPLVVQPLPAATIAALLSRRPALAAAGALATAWQTRRAFAEAGLGSADAPKSAAEALAHTWLGTARYTTQVASPLLLAAILSATRRSTGGTGRSRGRVAWALLLMPALETWSARRPAVDPVRFAIASTADDIAYGLGVWRGSLRARTAVALLPRIVRPTTRSRRRVTHGDTIPDTRGAR